MVAPMSERFVQAIERFTEMEGVDLVTFEKGHRKDNLAQEYLAAFDGDEGALFVGKAQRTRGEKADPGFPRPASICPDFSQREGLAFARTCNPPFRTILPEDCVPRTPHAVTRGAPRARSAFERRRGDHRARRRSLQFPCLWRRAARCIPPAAGPQYGCTIPRPRSPFWRQRFHAVPTRNAHAYPVSRRGGHCERAGPGVAGPAATGGRGPDQAGCDARADGLA
jgi:hypothetical protein